MEKTVADIKKQMTDSFISNQNVIDAYQLTPQKTFEEEFSTASIESIIFYCMAYAVWLLYQFFDLFKKEIDTSIKNYTHPTLTFYTEKIKTFQFGDNVITGTDTYNNTGLTDAQIEAKRIIKYAAAQEQAFTNGRYGVRIKVATDNNGMGEALTPQQYTAALAFLNTFKYAGVYTQLTTNDADNLKLFLRIYYNPLVLNNQGQRLDGTDNEPVQKAIKTYLKNLQFNGEFNLTALTDVLQQVNGVEDPRVLQAQTKYAALPYTDVIDKIIPDAGYLKIYNSLTDLQIEWVAKNE